MHPVTLAPTLDPRMRMCMVWSAMTTKKEFYMHFEGLIPTFDRYGRPATSVLVLYIVHMYNVRRRKCTLYCARKDDSSFCEHSSHTKLPFWHTHCHDFTVHELCMHAEERQTWKNDADWSIDKYMPASKTGCNFFWTHVRRQIQRGCSTLSFAQSCPRLLLEKFSIRHS